jgi:hypothetical protein
MDKENVAYVCNGVLFSHKELDYIICRKMDGTRDYHKPGSEKQKLWFFSFIKFEPKNDNDNNNTT